METYLFWLIPIASVVALIFAGLLCGKAKEPLKCKK